MVNTPDQEDDVLLVELFNATYDSDTKRLTYESDILTGDHGEGLAPIASKQQDQEIAATFDSGSVFIDDCADGIIQRYFGQAAGAYTGAASVNGILEVGFSYSWGQACCAPCDHPDNLYWSEQCNIQFQECDGNCIAWEQGDDVACWGIIY